MRLPIRKAMLGMALVCMLLFLSTNAIALNLSFSPLHETIAPGEEVKIDLMIDSDQDFTTLHLYVDYSDTSILDVTGYGIYFDAFDVMYPGAGDYILSMSAPPGLGDPWYVELYANAGSYLGHFNAYTGAIGWITFVAQEVGTAGVYYDSTRSGWTPAGAGITNGSITVTDTPVPEPATMLLLGSGIVGLAGFRRKRATKGRS